VGKGCVFCAGTGEVLPPPATGRSGVGRRSEGERKKYNHPQQYIICAFFSIIYYDQRTSIEREVMNN